MRAPNQGLSRLCGAKNSRRSSIVGNQNYIFLLGYEYHASNEATDG